MNNCPICHFVILSGSYSSVNLKAELLFHQTCHVWCFLPSKSNINICSPASLVLEGPAISVAVVRSLVVFTGENVLPNGHVTTWELPNMWNLCFSPTEIEKKMHKTDQRWGLSLTQIWRFEQLHRWKSWPQQRTFSAETDRRISGGSFCI